MKTLIINGHPDLLSYTSHIAKRIYERNPKHFELLNIAELDFNPVFKGYGQKTQLEPDLLRAQQSIKEADHIIIVTPIWWSTYPALLKGFFDRVLLPGFAFRYDKKKKLPVKLLTGKTAELILLSDAPTWYRRFLLGDPAAKILKRDILGFCGIKVKRIERIGNMHSKDESQKSLLLSRYS